MTAMMIYVCFREVPRNKQMSKMASSQKKHFASHHHHLFIFSFTNSGEKPKLLAKFVVRNWVPLICAADFEFWYCVDAIQWVFSKGLLWCCVKRNEMMWEYTSARVHLTRRFVSTEMLTLNGSAVRWGFCNSSSCETVEDETTRRITWSS